MNIHSELHAVKLCNKQNQDIGGLLTMPITNDERLSKPELVNRLNAETKLRNNLIQCSHS